MNTVALVRIRIALYTLSSLGIAWQTSMSGVDWNSMTWVGKSCLFGGMAALWGQTMFAFFDKAAWKLDEERKNLVNGVDKQPNPATGGKI